MPNHDNIISIWRAIELVILDINSCLNTGNEIINYKTSYDKQCTLLRNLLKLRGARWFYNPETIVHI